LNWVVFSLIGSTSIPYSHRGQGQNDPHEQCYLLTGFRKVLVSTKHTTRLVLANRCHDALHTIQQLRQQTKTLFGLTAYHASAFSLTSNAISHWLTISFSLFPLRTKHIRALALISTPFASELFDCLWRDGCRRRHRPGFGDIRLLIGWFAGEAIAPVLEVANPPVIWATVAFALTIGQNVAGH
uniref:Tick transposon n=1 Tax=Taenia asiatica TaxID=60517 RepID=A0A0R3W059_TAEAS